MHRDLKPKNILIVKSEDINDMKIKVTDFGLAEEFFPDSVFNEMVGTSYYMAPEVVMKESYNEKCDVWSIGVILYILLSGVPPFDGPKVEDIKNAIKKGKFTYANPIWRNVSNAAKDLIDKLLNPCPSLRPSLYEVYKHEWIVLNCDNNTDSKNMGIILKQLGKFDVKQKLQQAVLMYLATHMLEDKKKSELQKIFKTLDRNGDGFLTRDELIMGFNDIIGEHENVSNEVDKIIAEVDVDLNGKINYSEFILALMNKKKMLCSINLKQAFDAFDEDRNGYITADEVKKILGFGNNFSNEVWEYIINEIDEDHDKRVSFDEFENMMKKLKIKYN